MRMLAVFVAALVALPAAAQKDDDAVVARERRTVIDFDAEIIDGAVQGPDARVDVVLKRPRFKTLIRPRTSFTREVMGSATRL